MAIFGPKKHIFGFPVKNPSGSDSKIPDGKSERSPNSPYIDFILAHYNPRNETFEIDSFDIGVG